jgi:hypothetical protein
MFGGKAGMRKKDFEGALSAWNDAWKKYVDDISSGSVNATDEVGSPTRSQYCKDHPGECGG